MLIRRMTMDDVPEAVQIENICFSQPWSESSFRDSLSREDTIFLVCENADGIAGYMGMYVSFDEAAITNVAVRPECRKQGIGEKIVAEAKRAAKEMAVNTIFLEVRVSNIPAISLYKKMGFEILGIRKNFYEHPREDAYMMSCRLASES